MPPADLWGNHVDLYTLTGYLMAGCLRLRNLLPYGP
eukprot:COSAG05_NODE_612_length_8357_cov_40.832647_6_plen_36_part_00